MRVAIISDLHGNQEALEACLADAGRTDELWCLGDLVGYGAEPNECVRRVREAAAKTVLGNHDAAAIDQLDLRLFGPYARASGHWTREQLDSDVREYLHSLPIEQRCGDVLLVHATPASPEEWRYLFSTTFARMEFDAFSESVCFIGHSHVPVIYEQAGDSMRGFNQDGRFSFKKGCRYIINVGSVGQPRDGDPRAAYVLFEPDAGWLEMRRVNYDVAAVQAKIRAAGLPEVLADRLSFGE